MKKQFAAAIIKDEKLSFVKGENGQIVFDTLEEAETSAVISKLPNVKIYSREVSDWQFEGDIVSNNKGHF